MKWILGWAAAISVLALAVAELAEFAHRVLAELHLARAARAAAMEATLPRASCESICNVARRRLAGKVGRASLASVSILQNGAPVGRRFQPEPGDQITVAISMPHIAVLPYWLEALDYFSHDESITVRAEREVPGKHFRSSEARRL